MISGTTFIRHWRVLKQLNWSTHLTMRGYKINKVWNNSISGDKLRTSTWKENLIVLYLHQKLRNRSENPVLSLLCCGALRITDTTSIYLQSTPRYRDKQIPDTCTNTSILWWVRGMWNIPLTHIHRHTEAHIRFCITLHFLTSTTARTLKIGCKMHLNNLYWNQSLICTYVV